MTAGLAAALVSALLLATPGDVTPELLRERHAGARSLSADVVQTKEGRYWARPMVSHVRLRWTPELVEWETLDPVHSTVIIEGDRARVAGGAGGRALGPVAGDPRFTALVRFLRALAAFDLPALERDFSLTWLPRQVAATPRPGSSLDMLRSVVLTFDERGEIRLIEIATPSETTRLEFTRVERTR